MATRRTLLSMVAGTTALLAGCGSAEDSADDSPTVTAADATGAPGEEIAVSVTAQQVAVLTFGVGDIPENWPVTYADFEPEPAMVRETYPEELVWDPAADSVTGTLTVAVADDAESGEYELQVEVRTGDSEERATATATLTVEA